MSSMTCTALLLAVALVVLVPDVAAQTTTGVIGGPIPAANLPYACNSVEKCCMPTPYTGKPIYQFEYPTDLPMRTRPAAHLVSDDYIEKIKKGYKLLRELPDSDPRSLLNQMNLHCLYCDYSLYYPGWEYALAVHNGWLFLPWHRLFLYFHERIIAKLLDDDTFALPYWAWDDSSDVTPVPDQMPEIYADSSSPLYDPIRNNCSFPPFLADLDTIGGCTNKTADYIRLQNTRLMYTQLVTGAPTTSLFYGLPYRFGDSGGPGPGTLEDFPHGTVHLWVGDPNAPPPYIPFDDMGHFHRTAFDPIFYAHHGNVDRMWTVWETIPGGVRTHPKDPVFLDSQFVFYDENANLVRVNVSQSLDTNKLKYKYQSNPLPWLTNGVQAGKENSIALCYPLSKSGVLSLISNTPKFKKSVVLGATPITFKVNRPKRQKKGTEVLELSGIHIPDDFLQVHWKAYLFFPTANLTNAGTTCPEWAGTFNFIPVVGQPTINPKRVWRMAIGPKLKQIGKDYVDSIVVTIVQESNPIQIITFDKAKIFYDLSPKVSI